MTVLPAEIGATRCLELNSCHLLRKGGNERKAVLVVNTIIGDAKVIESFKNDHGQSRADY